MTTVQEHGDIMTTQEAAQYLKIPRSSINAYANRGQLPGKKIGRHWRFHREVLDNFLIGVTKVNR